MFVDIAYVDFNLWRINMKRFIVIAGPQAAGKTTVISALNEQYQNLSSLITFFGQHSLPFLFPLQESRQIMIHRDVVLGGIFMTPEQELEVIKWDLNRMDLILAQKHDNLVYLDECNVFTIAHALAHQFARAEDYWDEYMARLEKLQAGVIFLDVPFQLSWDRRQHRYKQRLVCFPESDHARIMEEYYFYLVKLGPELLKIYERLTIPKIKIDASLPKNTVMQNVSKALAELASFSANP
jgi:thymidylate kinase